MSDRRPVSGSCSMPNLISANVISVVKRDSPDCAATNPVTMAAGRGLRSNDVASGNRLQQTVEFIGPDNHHSVPAMQRNALRPALLRLPHHLAESGLGVLQAPAIAWLRSG